MTTPPARVDTPPEPISYVKLLRKTYDTMPPPKVAARPELVPLMAQAKELLDQTEPDSAACLALFQQIVRVPPAS